MSREDDVRAVLASSAPLVALLTGGIYTWTALGWEGITRESAPGAFDSLGRLRPCALVKQRGEIPDGIVQDEEEQVMSTAQIVEIWMYEDRGYTNLDAAAALVIGILFGYKLANAAPMNLVNVLDRQVDQWGLKGRSLYRQDWSIYSVRSF